jgi:cell division GTPase FtsZ
VDDTEIQRIIAQRKLQKENNMKRAVQFGIVGIGQGGGRLAGVFHKLGYPTVAVNTSPQDLEPLEVGAKVALGTDGAGRDIEIGREAVERNKDAIISALQKAFGSTGVNYVLLCSGSSGGTGGGGLSPMVDVVKSLQLPIGVMTTLPLRSEDTRSKRNTLEVLKRMFTRVINGEVAPFILMDNEKIIQNYPDLSTLEFWNKANDEVVKIFDLFNVLAARNSAYTSLDPADYKKILKAKGCMIFGAISVKDASGEDAISSILTENLEGGLLATGFNLLEATHAGAIVVAKRSALSKIPRKAEENAMSTLLRLLGSGTVYKGVYESEKVDNVEVLTAISGLQLPVKRIRDLVEESKREEVHLEKKTELKNVDEILKEFEGGR